MLKNPPTAYGCKPWREYAPKDTVGGIVSFSSGLQPDAIILDIVESLGIHCAQNLPAVFFDQLISLAESLFRFVDMLPPQEGLGVGKDLPQHLQQPWSVGH